MKELTLNPDGTFNIINPTKCFIFKIYIIHSNSTNYWINMNNGPNIHGFKILEILGQTSWLLFDEPYLQYSCEAGLKFCQRNQDSYIGHLYQFESKDEFAHCHARGEI